jgi:hypothetical protein
MATKTVAFSPEGIAKLPNDKPVVYKILTGDGVNTYTGAAQRGRVQARVQEHLPGAKDPIRGGAKVQIEQMPSIDDAKAKESRVVARSRPSQNKLGK